MDNTYSYTITYNGNSVTLEKDATDKYFKVSTPVTVQSVLDSKTTTDVLNKVTSVTVVYNGKSYTVDVPELVTVQKLIAKEPAILLGWSAYEVTNKAVDGQYVSLTGIGATKTLTISGGQLTSSKVYTVTLNSANSITVKNASNVAVTITKTTDEVKVQLN
jgi:hypothetical protein